MAAWMAIPLALAILEGLGMGMVAAAAAPPCGLGEDTFIRHDPETCPHGFPFLDLATGRRFPGRGRVVKEEPALKPPPAIRTGYGLPCPLRWDRQPGARAQLLSFREGDAFVRGEVTGLDEVEVAFRGPVQTCAVETLRAAGGPGETSSENEKWTSSLQRLQVDVRGVFPFAGDPAALGEHRNGRGMAARFHEAFDAARIPVRSCCAPPRWDLVVTDPRGHVLLRVTPDGDVSVFCGEPDQPGHLDSPALRERLRSLLACQDAPPPRFNRPTFLAARRLPEWSAPELLVSDSGNQVIRRVSLSGKNVETLAGTPGLPGHHDSARPREALFNDPQGLTTDPEGNVYVADRGNFVIRRIDGSGQVTTLAGSPGQAGSVDGLGGSARFADLRGLACQAGDKGAGGILYVADGHAVRAVTFPEGAVVTLLGQVATPGFRDLPSGAAEPRPACLRGPTGLSWHNGALYVADTGNHALRRADPHRGSLVTLVGDPAADRTRWGLLRDGAPGPLGPCQAALESPTALSAGPEEGAAMRVCAGRCLAAIRDGGEVRDTPRVTEVACRNLEGANRAVTFRVLTLDPQKRSTARGFHYSVDFLEPDGTLSVRREGHARSSDLVMALGAGTGGVTIRCVTDEGVAAGAVAN